MSPPRKALRWLCGLSRGHKTQDRDIEAFGQAESAGVGLHGRQVLPQPSRAYLEKHMGQARNSPTSGHRGKKHGQKKN